MTGYLRVENKLRVSVWIAEPDVDPLELCFSWDRVSTMIPRLRRWGGMMFEAPQAFDIDTRCLKRRRHDMDAGLF